MDLEPAIPPHLRCERTLPSATPSDYNPPFPAYCARFPESARGLVMAVVGVQFASRAEAEADKGAAMATLARFLSSSSSSSPSPSPSPPSDPAAAEGADIENPLPPPPPPRPSFSEVATVVDAAGFFNAAFLAYWPSRAAYDDWAARSGFEEWWAGIDTPVDDGDDDDHDRDDHDRDEKKKKKKEKRQPGWFREVFFPSMDRFETVFSGSDLPEGAAHMRVGVSGPVREHVYWGSMRDRLPVAQTDALFGVGWCREGGGGGATTGTTGGTTTTTTTTTSRKRIRVPGRPNLTVIRSGQDWRDTRPAERALYLRDMHPVLARGMAYLRDRGAAEAGCFSCRLMEVVGAGPRDVLSSSSPPSPPPTPTPTPTPTPSSHPPDPPDLPSPSKTDRTFGLAYFDSLGSLERWSREHPTHLDIFGGFLRYAAALGNDISLRLFHEVLVLRPEQQLLEYVGCHAGTGMLVALEGGGE